VKLERVKAIASIALVALPWFVWATVSIFNIRQDVAVIKAVLLPKSVAVATTLKPSKGDFK
jgi:hypothetical protein